MHSDVSHPVVFSCASLTPAGTKEETRARAEIAAVQNFVLGLRRDPRFAKSHFVFMVENQLSRNVAARLHLDLFDDPNAEPDAPKFGPITALHDDVNGRKEYVPTSNETKQLGYGLFNRILSERRIFFAKQLVTTNDSGVDAKRFLEEDMSNCIVKRKKTQRGTTFDLTGKERGTKTDDLVMAFVIGLAHWARWRLTRQYASGTCDAMASIGTRARLARLVN